MKADEIVLMSNTVDIPHLTLRKLKFICVYRCMVSDPVASGAHEIDGLSAVDCLKKALKNLRDLLTAVDTAYDTSLK